MRCSAILLGWDAISPAKVGWIGVHCHPVMKTDFWRRVLKQRRIDPKSGVSDSVKALPHGDVFTSDAVDSIYTVVDCGIDDESGGDHNIDANDSSFIVVSELGQGRSAERVTRR